MQSISRTIINSREDLDALAGTPEYDAFMAQLAGSMTRREDIQIYPDGYSQPGYDGPRLPPVWQEVEDLSTIERFGFSKTDFAGK